MSESKTPKVNFSALRRTVLRNRAICFLCGANHERRPGPVNLTSPICADCAAKLNRGGPGPQDEVDFHIKGF